MWPTPNQYIHNNDINTDTHFSKPFHRGLGISKRILQMKIQHIRIFVNNHNSYIAKVWKKYKFLEPTNV